MPVRIAIALGLASLLWLAACGGDREVTPLPTQATISAPGTAELGAAVAFDATLQPAGTEGLSFLWDFGDGNRSTEARPSHRYTRAEDFEVTLTLTNEDGESMQVRATVGISYKAHVAGLVCMQEQQEGWCWQRPVLGPRTVTQLKPFDRTQAWVISGYPDRSGWPQHLLTTRDGGTTWLPRPFAFGHDLADLASDGAGVLWAINSQGGLLRSDDDGQRWSSLGRRVQPPVGSIETIAPPYTIRAFRTAAGTTDLLVNESWISRDVGQTWARLPYDARVDARGTTWGVRAPETYAPQLWKSDDYGVTRELLAARCNGTSHHAPAVGGNGEVVLTLTVGGPPSPERPHSVSLERRFCVSRDGGATWRTGGAVGSLLCDFSCSRFEMQQQARFVAGDVIWTHDGWRSTDGGETMVFSGPPGLTHTITAFFGPATVYAQDRIAGSWMVSRDNGQSWTTVARRQAWTEGPGSAVRLENRRILAWRSGVLMQSNDDGRSWTERALAPSGDPRSLQFAGRTHGWLVAEAGRLLHTTDAGETWNEIWSAAQGWTPAAGESPTARIGAVHFSSQTAGVLALSPQGEGRRSTILATSDGGRTWSERSTLPLTEVDTLVVLPGGQVVVAGRDCAGEPCAAGEARNGSVHVSRDGGRSFERTQSLGLARPWRLRWHAEAERLWLVGWSGLVMVSDDLAATWRPVALDRSPFVSGDAMIDIAFSGRNGIWILDQRPAVIASRDGGLSWRQQKLTLNPLPLTGPLDWTDFDAGLSTLLVADARTAWAFGPNGVVLATSTGGF